MAEEKKEIDYTLANPDTLTKYKTAAEISNKVLNHVVSLVKEGTTVLALCEEGDKLLEEETSKVFKGKDIKKGISFPTTVSPDEVITPLTPNPHDTNTPEWTIKAGQVLKIQLGAHIDGFAAVVGSTIVVPASEGAEAEITGEVADLLLATHYINQAFLRLILPPSLHPGAEEGKEVKPPTHTKINSILNSIAKTYGCSLVENTTSYQFERNEIEGKKKIILAPTEGTKGEGNPEIGDVWGVEVAVALGDSGKLKVSEHKPTLFRNTGTTFQLKRPTSRQTFSEIKSKFGNFPFSSKYLTDQKAAAFGLVECVRGNLLRQYEVLVEKEGKITSKDFSVVAVTKKGLSVISAPPAIDLEKVKSDKQITDEEILKLLETPIGAPKKANKKKKKAGASADE
ncbi:Curved DNA-binding protein (42 kDa protein) [Orbilia blumenaviensis]|uniref:Curved DNA-binding protein (42 kDa protein) n=1 Tax=Orbilia blumenaviensis TaxID=1796055 RepID=A0AAV9V8S8_9PEZI